MYRWTTLCALALLATACSEQPTAPLAARPAPAPPAFSLAPEDPDGPPSPHPFAPDTYRTHLFTGAGTPTGLTCTGSVADGRTCSGYLASGVDETRLDVTLEIPPIPAAGAVVPLVALLHGWAGSKNSSSDIGTKLVADGYAVLRYSARGFGESWGQANLADKHVELPDLRSLIGQVTDIPEYNLNRTAVAVTGASYGGGQSWLAALQPTFPSPSGETVTIRTVVPIVPWTDLLYSLVPNGRPRESWNGLGSPKLSYLNGLYASGIRKPTDHPDRAYPNYPDYLVLWHAWMNFVEPNDFDPVWRRIVGGLAGGRSIWWQQTFWNQAATAQLPVFEVQGFTDDLFPLPEAERMYNALRPSGYPISLYLGDIGHPRASNKPKEVDYVLELIKHWFAYYLKGEGPAPVHQVYAAITRDRDRLDFDPATDVITAPSIAALATERFVRSFNEPVVLVNPVVDPLRGFRWDPFVLEGAAQLSYNPTEPLDPPLVPRSLGTFTVPASDVNDGQPFLVAGKPRVALEGIAVGLRVQLDIRLIDVEPGVAGRKRLITRGTYTIDNHGRPIGAFDVTIPSYGNLFEVPADHTLLLQITNLDTPYITPSRLPSQTTITNVTIEIPIRPPR